MCCCIPWIWQVGCAGDVWTDTHRRKGQSVHVHVHDATLLTFFTVHVRSRNPKRVHDRPLESSHALLPLAHHTSTDAKNCLLCVGRAVWDLDGRGDGLDRNKTREPYSVDPIWQDMSQLRKSPDISLRNRCILTIVYPRQTAG